MDTSDTNSKTAKIFFFRMANGWFFMRAVNLHSRIRYSARAFGILNGDGTGRLVKCFDQDEDAKAKFDSVVEAYHEGKVPELHRVFFTKPDERLFGVVVFANADTHFAWWQGNIPLSEETIRIRQRELFGEPSPNVKAARAEVFAAESAVIEANRLLAVKKDLLKETAKGFSV